MPVLLIPLALRSWCQPRGTAMQFLPATGAFESVICIHPIFMEHLIFAASVGWASARMIAALKSPIPVVIRIDICVPPRFGERVCGAIAAAGAIPDCVDDRDRGLCRADQSTDLIATRFSRVREQFLMAQVVCAATSCSRPSYIAPEDRQV
jgi:hypothetical protein